VQWSRAKRANNGLQDTTQEIRLSKLKPAGLLRWCKRSCSTSGTRRVQRKVQ